MTTAKRPDGERQAMTPQEKYRVRELARKSKSGVGLTDDEQRFVAEMYRKHPKEYSEASEAGRAEAVDAYTGPFRSQP